MRKFSAKIGVTALFALALFTLSISQASAQKFKDKAEGPVTLEVDCDAGESIQASVDSAGEGDTINVSGTCTEIVTITTDGITIIGQGESATLMGGFIVDGAQRAVIDNLTIDGSTSTGRVDGVRAQFNAHVTVRNCTIQNHTRIGVRIVEASSALIEGNMITVNEADGADSGVAVSRGSFAILRGTTENPTQTITSDLASGSFGNSLGVFNDSNARLNGGNLIVGTGNATAIGVFNDASLRLSNGLNTVLGTGGRAIDAGRNSLVSLRFFDVTGRIGISTNSTLELGRRLNVEPDPDNPTNVVAVITGDIRVRSGAQVQFSNPFIARNLRPGGPNQGSVTVNGRLLCFGNEGHVAFGTGRGQTIEVVFPSQADRLAWQCNDFNGNPVLPPQCSDGIDNDGDTFIDFPADLQCVDAADNDESS